MKKDAKLFFHGLLIILIVFLWFYFFIAVFGSWGLPLASWIGFIIFYISTEIYGGKK